MIETATGPLGKLRENRHLIPILLRSRLLRGRMIREYMAAHAMRKLHLGCSDHLLPGWLNSDLRPVAAGVICMDATAPMPFVDRQFERVFSEHMIEHVPYQAGTAMLGECFRVLRHGGRLRISTPDLAFLVDLYRPDRSELQERYITWSQAAYGDPAHGNGARHARGREVFVINAFVRSWGHRFIYDEQTLRAAFEDAGFENVTRCALNESDDALFQGLENDRRMPDRFLGLETLTLEGTRPAGP